MENLVEFRSMHELRKEGEDRRVIDSESVC